MQSLLAGKTNPTAPAKDEDKKSVQGAQKRPEEHPVGKDTQIANQLIEKPSSKHQSQKPQQQEPLEETKKS